MTTARWHASSTACLPLRRPVPRPCLAGALARRHVLVSPSSHRPCSGPSAGRVDAVLQRRNHGGLLCALAVHALLQLLHGRTQQRRDSPAQSCQLAREHLNRVLALEPTGDERHLLALALAG